MKWDATLYDQKHGFVSAYGEELIELLNPLSGEQVLDIGCGTGDLAAQIRQKGAIVTGIDNSPEMIAVARGKYPGIGFDVKPAADFSYDTGFDAVFSNATLHWVLEKEKAVQCIRKALKPGGRFVAELGGEGNVAGIIHAMKNVLYSRGYAEAAEKKAWYFPSLSDYAQLLEQNGLRVVYAAMFNRPTVLKEADGIKNWTRMFGQSFLQHINSEMVEHILNDVEAALRPTNFRNGNWYADYIRLRVMAVKPE